MDIWTERVESHALHQQLDKLDELLKSSRKRAHQAPETTEQHSRLKQVLDLVRKAMASNDPAIIPMTVLNNLNSQFTSQVNELTNFINNGNHAHLVSANNHADAALVQVLGLVQLARSGADDLKDVVTSVRMSAGQHMRHLNDDLAQTQERFATLKDDLAQVKSQINDQKIRLDEAINNFQTRAEEAETKRRSMFEDLQTSRKESFELLMDQAEARSLELTEASRKEAQEALDFLDTKRREAESIVEITAGTAMSGDYEKVARQERRALRFWRGVTVAFMVTLAGGAGWAFYATLSGAVDWPVFGARLVLIGAVGIGAAYAAKLADRHHEELRRTRRLALELAAITPYLASLPEDDQHKVKIELAERVFVGQAVALEGSESQQVTSGSLLDLLKMVLSNLTKS